MQYVLKQKLVSLGNNFTIKDVDVFYEKGAPKTVAADSLGVAVK